MNQTRPPVRWFVSQLLIVLLVSFIGCDHGSPSTVNDTKSPNPPAVALTSDKLTSDEPSINLAKRHLRTGNPDRAADVVYELMIQQEQGETDDQLSLLAAQIELARRKPMRAIEILGSIDLSESEYGSNAAEILVDQATLAGDPKLAESALQSMTNRFPLAATWRHQYWRLLQRQGRLQEASHQVDQLCRIGQATEPELLSIINRNEVFPIPKSDAPPEDFSTRAVSLQAKWYIARQLYDEAENALAPLVESGFHHDSDVALYLRVLAEKQEAGKFPQSHAQYANRVQRYADYWCGLGKFLIDQSDFRGATGALLRAVEIDPTMRIAFQRLSQSLGALNHAEDAAQFRYRGVQIAESESMARQVAQDDQNRAVRSDLAKRLLELGRPLEMLEWTRSVIPTSAMAQLAYLAQKRREIASVPENSMIASTTALLELDPNDFPIAESLTRLSDRLDRSNPSTPHAPKRPPTAVPRFVNVAREQGADFQWFHDTEINFDSIPLYESIGGGIAAFDYDLDGWPDLYFAQGSGRPPQLPTTRSNELRRNLAGNFARVTENCGAGDNHYSSGVAAGDVNQDGFPDLYLGALGKNRLLINNGDGTFRDATESMHSSGDRFTASVAIADLDGDAIPDLFEVNYIELENGFAQPKKNADGRFELPSPLLFYPQSDRYFVASGKGTFLEQSIDDSVAAPATGLGLIVTDFDNAVGNEVFVGNDLRENHFLRLSEDRLVNIAPIIGLANGSSGLANGCMGIATGDFDRNGTLDLHVGNYRGESDNLYLQDPQHVFRDQAARYGIRDLSLPLVAFGCKTFDVDRNGWLDLVVTNGHIFDMRPVNQGYKMRPHLLLSDGESFQTATVDDPSGYWTGSYLGRSMALIDFNRDQATDLVIGHLDAPSALLKNETKATGNHILLELVGTKSERDAVGARVVVVAGDETVTQWVTAGDGYFCSDENYLDLAIAQQTRIDQITIQWPSGQSRTYESVPINGRYLAIEGQNGLFPRTPD